MIRSIASVLARPAVHVDLDDDISSFRVIDHEKYFFWKPGDDREKPISGKHDRPAAARRCVDRRRTPHY